MRTKLTLRLDEDLIRRAKSFAKERSKSVSQVVADYFASLGKDPSKDRDRKALTPIVRSLKGAMRGADVDLEDYHRHLEQRHL